MSNHKLKMTYHPAKKEVLFERFMADGTPVMLKTERWQSRLCMYMDRKGQFILQDHGDAFFEDIAKAFDGETSIDIGVITTKSDFGDFEQMVEYYNEGHKVKINATLLAELPDMNTTFIKVKDHGEKAIAILEKHKEDFYTVRSESPAVRGCIDMFSKQVHASSALIREKIDCMGDNNINLCFTGVYSTGKSTLINAILGYRILPEAIKSETARMFKIKSPQKGSPVRIIFDIQGSFSEVLWSEKKATFEFGAAPTENEVRESIQTVINSVCQERQHVQILEILKTLNGSKDVGSVITVYFPIPLDSPNIQFTIYDTPGADSNYLEHQEVLKDALSEQTHSILVFVAAPNKLEGSGNNALLSYLKEAEEKDSKTSIDIGRSLFVINMIDSFNDPEQRESLRDSRIIYRSKDIENNDTGIPESDESFSIELANKKLFFTSAMMGYAAKAADNGIATNVDNNAIKYRFAEVTDEVDGRYYMLDHVATSECATKKLIAYCNETMAEAMETGDRLTAIKVASGVYALEKEILIYGEKYAGAVKAFAIIDSVDKALSTMSKTAASLQRQNQDDINAVNREIEHLRVSLEKSFADAYDHYKIRDRKIPDNTMKELRIDKESLMSAIQRPAQSMIEKILKGWFFGHGRVLAKESHKKQVKQGIRDILSDYSSKFLESRQKELKSVRDSFVNDIQTAIRNNGDISDEAKRYVCDDLPEYEIRKFTNLEEFGDLYNSNIRIDKFWFRDRERIDKEAFEADATRRLAALTGEMAEEFADDYVNELSSVLDKIKTDFTQKMDEYSILMKAKLADKEAMEELRMKIVAIEEALSSCQAELNSTIWSVSENG